VLFTAKQQPGSVKFYHYYEKPKIHGKRCLKKITNLDHNKFLMKIFQTKKNTGKNYAKISKKQIERD
jgi:hypothetical protein